MLQPKMEAGTPQLVLERDTIERLAQIVALSESTRGGAIIHAPASRRWPGVEF